ncbi:hypothetical protein SAMN05421881_101371 [Nitrosomonas halophila]|uniref:Uncharacterized protein n=1 Tax=Nitrosomonas halophila TaxID=44576 RepID=A0A1H3G2A1_9PROT|nr:hypothetical protein SAMN05421881_101371 [Nitrosomonas halophila]
MSSTLALLDDIRRVLHLKHYSLHTGRTCCDWIWQFVKFHRMTQRPSLFDHAAAGTGAFLMHLATQRGIFSLFPAEISGLNA